MKNKLYVGGGNPPPREKAVPVKPVPKPVSPPTEK